MDLVLSLPTFWPGRTVIAEPDSIVAYRQRPSSGQLSAAELYHENSKLFPARVSELAVSNLEPAVIRHEFLRRRAIVVAADGGAEIHPGTARWRAVLSRLATTADPELFYAIEVRAVANGRVGAHEPIRDALQTVKLLDAKEQSRLHDALRLLPATAARSQDPAFAKPWLLLIAWFSRNEILFGTRGYRRTLLEAGRLTEEIFRLAHEAGLETQPVSEFADRDVDAVMEADGIEQATLMAIEITEAPDAGDKGATS
jgi:hypothetical protein